MELDSMEDKKTFGTQIPDEVYQFMKAMEKPNTEREFSAWKSQLVGLPLAEQLEIVTSEIFLYKSKIGKPHTYPWFFTEFLKLLNDEQERLITILQQKKDFKEVGLIGVSTTFTDAQIETIYDNATNEGLIRTSKTNFFNILRGKECKEIIWLEYRGNNPNKTKLRYFIDFIFQSPNVIKPLARKYFKDKKGNPIETTSGQSKDSTIWDVHFMKWIE